MRSFQIRVVVVVILSVAKSYVEFASEIKTCHLSEAGLLTKFINKICFYCNTDSDSAQREEHFKPMYAYCMSYIEADPTHCPKREDNPTGSRDVRQSPNEQNKHDGLVDPRRI